MSSQPAFLPQSRTLLSHFTRDAAGVWQAPHAKPFNYSDGDATEERMYSIVSKASNTDVYSHELISQINDWPSEYHFSPRRANLIRVLGALNESHRVLELGCGCGAITKALAETGCRVDAIEGSPRRARVAATRVHGHANAAVYHSNFQDVEFDRKYDVVTLIGVLEYSPVYLDAEDPFVACLKIALDALKPDGTLLVAIENKLGLKYFSGVSEDHFNRPFYGIEGRYGKKEITTYGRAGLERKLRAAGFPNIGFYYPFPDYKLPEVLVAERALEIDGFRADDLLVGLENRDYSGMGKAAFNLDLSWQSLQEEGLLGELSNSFLVLASRGEQTSLVRPGLLAQKYTDIRRPGLNSVTEFVEDGAGVLVEKRAIGEEPWRSEVFEHSFTQERYRNGRNLLTLLRRAALTGRMEQFKAFGERWIAYLEAAADDQGMLPGDWLDAIPSNIIIHGDGGCSYIDREWLYKEPLRKTIPFYRGLLLLSGDNALKSQLSGGSLAERTQQLCTELGQEFDADECKAAIAINNALWHEVHADGQWWRADRYRHRSTVELSPPPPKPMSYAELLKAREPRAQRLIEHVKRTTPATRTRFELLVVAEVSDEQRDALARTLENIAAMACEPCAVTVLGGHELAIDHRYRQIRGADLPASLNQHLAESDADWIQVVFAGDTCSPLLLPLLDEQISAAPSLTAIYADEDSLHQERYEAPIFKPDLNLDLLRSYPYLGRALAFHRLSCLAVGGMSADIAGTAAQDLVFRLIESHGLQSIGHVAEPLIHCHLPYAQWLATEAVMEHSAKVVSTHLDRLGIAHELQPGAIPGFNRIRYLHARQPPVSIIIPTRDQLPMLNGLIDSLLAKTGYKNYELLIVDNDSRDPAACAYLDGIERLNNPQLRVLRWPHPFNYSAINNFAAGQARGEYLVLLNNDTAVLHEDWIEALLNHAQRPEVGIVGAKLHYPDGRIQHAGVVLGLRGPADHPFLGQPMDAPGYMHRLQVDQNYTAVTAACLMIRKSVYEEVGGLDEQDFKVSYNDVDLCLKVRQAGYLTVWTPYARLMHEGSVSQTKVDTTAQEAKLKRFQGEQAAMYRKWLPLLARDPAYNRNFSLDGPGFDLDTRATQSWQPFSEPLAPRLFCVAADLNGCGHYRVRQPFLSMQRAGLAEGVIADTHLTPVNLERFAPQAMVLQRQLTDKQIEIMGGYREYSRAFKVYELDDYLPNVPLKSVYRNAMPKDVLKSLRKAVALTDRFVVSTATLAEQFAGLHSDIRVVPNRLPVDWWGELPASGRRIGRKPRVGWGGGNSHRGDLELIADVVRDLADEVEWVFFGMCPDKLRPYVHEFHEGVPIGQYPAKLASLNLDLALAPLEDNVFNACKSNLRLLEYGICGFPVVCSDIVCYRDGLPVTRVRNRYKEWIDAIRMHLADLDATAAAGDALRDAVRRDWMLAGDNLVTWRAAWLPD